MSMLRTMSLSSPFKRAPSSISLVEAHAKRVLSLRKQKLEKKFAESRDNRTVINSINSLANLLKGYTFSINEVNMYLPPLLNWVPCHLSSTKEISFILDILLAISVKLTEGADYLVNTVNIVNFVDMLMKNIKGVCIEEKIIYLIGSIATEKETSQRLIEANAVHFLLSVLNKRNEGNVLWALSALSKKGKLRGDSIDEIVNIAIRNITEYDIERDTMYHSISILNNMFEYIRDKSILNHIVGVISKINDERNCVHILSFISDCFEERIDVLDYCVMNTELVVSLSQCLAAPSVKIKQQVYCIIAKIIRTQIRPLINVICYNGTLINSIIHSEIAEGLMCLNAILEQVPQSVKMSLLSRGIEERTLKSILEATSREKTVEVYYTLYIILETLAYAGIKRVAEFKEKCKRKGIVDRIENDIYHNDSQRAKLAERIIEEFFCDELYDDIM